MHISENKVVSLSYRLNLNNKNGELIETITKDKPLEFMFGSGNLLPEFENQLRNLPAGEQFAFVLTSDKAYGAILEEAIVDVPVTSFEVNGKVDESVVKLGGTIPMRDNNGNRMNGVVTALNSELVTMDFNHPLAGRDLHFEGEVLAIRDATEEELMNQLHSQSGGCGCGSGNSCQDGSCDDGCGCDSDDASHNHANGGCGCH